MEENTVQEKAVSGLKVVNVVIGALIGFVYGFVKYGFLGALVAAGVGAVTGFNGILMSVVFVIFLFALITGRIF